MSKKQQRNLEVVSRIDDEIIEKASRERASLLLSLKKRIRKTWLIRGGAMAASLFLIAATVLILVLALAKEVPVYTGMTVSNTAPTVTASATLPDYLAAGHSARPVTGHHTGADKTIGDKPFDKSISDAVGSFNPTTDEEHYYAKPNEDVYITVHIDNPDQFEILSFTLNDKKYQNHMFEDGSDLENIILKVNVGATEGKISYTIDAIKYVDGTEIKDVKIGGNRTVEIGVYTEKQPAATFTATAVDYNSISFAVDLSDTLNLFETLTGDVEAVLFDGTYIVGRQKLSTTEKTNVSFTGLKTGTLYQYAIIATYDALDGKGVARHVIASHATYTKSVVLFDNVTVDATSVSFGFLWDADFANKTLTSLSLYRNGIKEQSLDVTATAITGLKTDTGYTLTATYQNGTATEEISIFFVTDALTATVNQYLENLDGTFTVIKTEEFVVTQGTTFAPVIGSYEGFTTPTVAPVTLTTTSHVFDCYFTRTAYAVTFVGNNGDTTTEQLKFGMPLAPTTAPVRDGFTFGGWFENAELTVAAGSTVPAKTLAVYAKWLVEAAPTDLTYTVNGGKVTVTGLLNQGLTDLIIPAYIAGQPVTAIGDGAFYGKTTLRTVVLPDTVTEIGSSAFKNSGLTDITWSENLLTVGAYAFAFTKLTALTVPASVATIGDSAFEDCAWLTSITFKDRTTTLTVGTLAFRMTGAAGAEATLEKVVVEDLADWFNIVFPATGGIGALANPLHLGADLYVGDTLVEALTVPEGVTTIRPALFTGCTSLTSVIIPTSVTSVGENTFAACTNLQYVTFAAGSRASVGVGAFSGCSKLSSINLPTSLIDIGSYTFRNCTMLTSLDIPSSVTRVDPSAFENCAAVTVVDGISYVDGFAIGGTPTGDALSLRAGTVGIANYAFKDVFITGTLTLPEGLKYIGISAFAGFTCSGTLTIPDSVVSVGSGAFDGSSLVNEDTETGLVYIDKWLIDATNYNGYDIFADLRADTVGIAAVSFVVYLDETAVVAIPEGIKHLNGNIIIYVNDTAPTLHLPASLLSIGARSISVSGGSAAYWQGITVAAGNTVYSGTGNCLVEIATGTLVLGSATSIIPTDGSVTAIGASAFENCKGLTAIHIPASVTEIRTGAFVNCTALTTLTFAENSQLKVIWGSAFYGCRQLTGVVLPNGLTTLHHAAFTTYKTGGYIVVPTSVTTANLSFMAPNGIIYYCGEAGPAADMILPPSRIHDYNMAIYYYSATKPVSDHGSYWHWVGDVPTVWSAND